MTNQLLVHDAVMDDADRFYHHTLVLQAPRLSRHRTRRQTTTSA